MDEREGIALTSKKGEEPGFTTRAIHDGQQAEEHTGAVSIPIFLTSTYKQVSPGITKGYDYSRTDNPTREALEKSLASIEGAKHGLAFSSGMAAITAVSLLLRSGSKVLSSDDVYGGTYRLFNMILNNFGVAINMVDFSDLKAIEKEMSGNKYDMILIESPTNPLLKVYDIAEISALARKHHTLLVVDNTFMSPYLQNPLKFGADIVVHSTTKYIGGHSDVIGGAIMLNDDSIYNRLKFIQNSTGAVPSPFDAWLTLRGIKTLSLRMRAHCDNAMEIFRYLAEKKEKGFVDRIYFPGNPGTKYNKIQVKQAKGYGGMISFSLNSPKAKEFAEALDLFTLGESLGGVESLVEIPALMTHQIIPRKEREARGITDGLIRLSVGIEEINDLINDLEKGFKKVFG
ncbi:MAG: trans-sulfuration enzyme family protein [Thermoplasmataceae archaeon]